MEIKADHSHEDAVGDNSTVSSHMNASEKCEDSFKLTRKKFMRSYKLHYALKSVIIHPFEARNFGLAEFVKWSQKAKEFTIKRTWKGNSVCMMSFGNYADADGCISDLRSVLDDRVDIRHTQANTTNPEIEVDAILNYAIRASLSTRVIVLEGLPDDVTQEQIAEFFPDARTVLLANQHADTCGLALVEYESADRVQQVVEQHTFAEDRRSYIVCGGRKVALSKYKNRLNLAERTWRRQPPVAERRYSDTPLDDAARLDACRELQRCNDARSACLDDQRLAPTQRIHRYVQLSDEMSALAARLNWDANRREREKLALPETDDMKTWKLLYKEDQEDRDYTHTKERSPPATDNGEVRSLLDINPFEVPGGKRPADSPPADAPPPKRLVDASFPLDFSNLTGGQSMIQGLRNISEAFAMQLGRIDDLLQTSWSGNTMYRNQHNSHSSSSSGGGSAGNSSTRSASSRRDSSSNRRSNAR